jgi:ribosomal protein L29
MTVRTWPQLTQSEKIEDLKRDVVRIFKVLRENQDAIASDQQRLQSQIDELRKRLTAKN